MWRQDRIRLVPPRPFERLCIPLPEPTLRLPPTLPYPEKMSIPAKIAYLDEYRVRREQRLRRSLALYGADPERSRVASRLAEALAVVEGDRASAVWVDEYGPGLVHVHCLIDAGADEPRGDFPIEPLRDAWDRGVPGLLDRPGSELSGGTQGGARSLRAVALGSDGSRAWFVIVDSAGRRIPLDAIRRTRLMFVAGECAGVLLHQDVASRRVHASAKGSKQDSRGESFAGWSVLKDIEGRPDESTSRRISSRFLVARLINGLVEEAFQVDPDSLAHQLEGIRREIKPSQDDDVEQRAWSGVLDAVQRGSRPELLGQLLAWGVGVEELGHFYGAQEIFRVAFDVAVGTGSVPAATDAARFHARTARKLSDFEVCDEWYGRALHLAKTSADVERMAHIYSGQANAFRERGNLPSAREAVASAIHASERGASRATQAMCHHSMMAVDKAQGNWTDAVIEGWEAFELYNRDEDKLTVLSDLAELLAEGGALGSAEDAYSVVIHRTRSAALRALATAGRASVAAIRGNAVLFIEWIRRGDVEDWQSLPPSFRAQIALDRGVAYRIMGQVEEAKYWLERARDDAEAHRLHQVAYKAETEISALDTTEERSVPAYSPQDAGDPRVTDVLTELSALRAGL